MRFGAVPDNDLAAIDLRLPGAPVSNTAILPGKRVEHPRVYVGAATWGTPSWSGQLYPVKTPASLYRQLYPQQFTAIELDATHYTIYPPDTMQQWAAAAKGKEFKFCPKFPQQISHQSGFIQAELLTDAFIESVTALGGNLGPLFLQVSESFSPVNKDVLYNYLTSLPQGLQYFLELRHPAWFAVVAVREELFATLQQLGMGAVITDAPGRRDLAHMQLAVPKLFLRFVCNGLHATSFARTDSWVQQLKGWIEAGLEEAYIFLHPGNDGAVPELATYWIQELNDQCGLTIKAPALQRGLF